MPPETIAQNSFQNAPHPNYKRVIVIIALIFIIIIAGAVGYYYFSSKKIGDVASDPSMQQSQRFFAENPPSDTPMTDAEKKAITDFFAKNPVK